MLAVILSTLWWYFGGLIWWMVDYFARTCRYFFLSLSKVFRTWNYPKIMYCSEILSVVIWQHFLTTYIVWATTLTSKSRNDLRRHEGTPCVTSPQTLGKMERKCKIGKIEKNCQNLSLAVTTKILGPRITTNKWNVGLVYKVGYLNI